MCVLVGARVWLYVHACGCVCGWLVVCVVRVRACLVVGVCGTGLSPKTRMESKQTVDPPRLWAVLDQHPPSPHPPPFTSRIIRTSVLPSAVNFFFRVNHFCRRRYGVPIRLGHDTHVNKPCRTSGRGMVLL